MFTNKRTSEKRASKNVDVLRINKGDGNAARKAGSRLRRDFGEVEHLQVSRKGPADFVSKADMRAERTIYDQLLHARPDWGFVLEEAGIIEGDTSKPRWIVDPLDGTSNFLHGILTLRFQLQCKSQSLMDLVWGRSRPVLSITQLPMKLIGRRSLVARGCKTVDSEFRREED